MNELEEWLKTNKPTVIATNKKPLDDKQFKKLKRSIKKIRAAKAKAKKKRAAKSERARNRRNSFLLKELLRPDPFKSNEFERF
jgi:ribosome-binding ATPase YchF (GTP1/OBG family)